MKKLALLSVLIPLIAFAGYIKVWGPGEVFNVNNLNSNFAHIHSTMVGGHGPRLVNADVSASAAIAHAKLATPGLVPKSLVHVGTSTATPCGASPCSWNTLAGFAPTNVTRGGAGVYTVTFAVRTNAIYTVHINSSAGGVYCNAGAFATTNFGVNCFNAAGAPTDSAFQFTLLDDNT